MLSSQFFSKVAPSSLAILKDGFCNGVSSDVAKPGKLASFHCYQQGLCLPARESTCCLTHSAYEMQRSCLKHLVSTACMCLSVSAVRVQLLHP